MAAHLSLHEPLRCLQRHLADLLLQSADLLGAGDTALAVRIHETRKRLKRARAWALLLPKTPGGNADRALADLHRALGARRDRDALQEAIGRLLTVARTGSRARDGLLHLREQARAPAATTEELTQAAIDEVRDALRQLALVLAEESAEGDFSIIARHAARIARRSRRAMRGAIGSGDPHDFHRWRKWMKYHAFHLRYLAPLWPALLRIEADAAEQCAEWLGESQDLELVRQALSAGSPDAATAAATLVLVDREQERLLGKASSVGLHLHANTPKAFGRRLAGYRQARLRDH